MASLAPAATSSAKSFIRLAACGTRACRQQCPQCYRLRYFSSYKPLRQSSKRSLQTATQTSTLLHEPPPPRNVGIPDTSIAGDKTTGMEGLYRPWSFAQGAKEQQAALSNISIPEKEAQKSQPTTPPQSTPSTASPTPAEAPPKKRRPTRLRAREAPMKLTPTAVAQLRSLLDQPEPKLIRVGTRNKGCSGLAYHLEYIDKPGKLDEVVEQDGVKVLIENKALLSILGSEMDWVEDKLSARFTFKNPNIVEQCGCGESFSIG